MNSIDRAELIPLDAPTLVEASAGTGKTYAITTYFVRAILELGLESNQVLVVTYTKAATAELRARSRKRIVQALALLASPFEESDCLHEIVWNAVRRLGRNEVEHRLRRALGQMDQARILTIHGFCQRLLQDHPLLFGIDFDFEVAEDAASIYADLAVDFCAAELYDAPEWLLQALREAKVGTDHLARLADVATRPGAEILGPERHEANEETVARWLDLRCRAGALWIKHRNAISGILLNDERLNKRSYNPKSIQKTWIADLDDFFADNRFTYPPPCLSSLAQGKMKTKKGKDEPRHPFFEACADLQNSHDALLPMLQYAVFDFKARFIDYAREASRERRDETGVLTYDDLLTVVHAALDPSRPDGASSRSEIIREVRRAYPLALVDEFQDTDPVQYGILRAIYGDTAAVFVGDPKQAIYAFRGADVFSYIEAVADVGNRRHSLRTNRRSDPGVVRAVNALFSRRMPPFVLEGIGFEHAIPHEEASRSTLAPSVDVIFVGQEQLDDPLAEAVAPVVANEIALLLDSDAQVDGRPVKADDVAVLCRTNSQAIEVTNALRALNVPASLDGGSSVLETEIASDLRAVLAAVLEPGDSRTIRRALLTRLVGVSPYELSAMTDETWSDWVSRFGAWSELWHGHGVLRFLEDMLVSTDAEARIASWPEARRDLTDLLHLEELLLRGERERRSNPLALMQWFRRLGDGSGDANTVAQEDLQQRPDVQSGAVRVCTIHKSKGLEYGIVYCPFPWENPRGGGPGQVAVKFHDEHRRAKLDLGSPRLDEHKKQADQEELSDALRLLYVALTRAKHQCTLFWGRTTGWKTAALSYLLHGEHRFEKLEEDELREAVEKLAAESSGTIGCRAPHEKRATPWREQGPATPLSAIVSTRSFSHAARIASFTSLTGHDEKMPASGTGSPSIGSQKGLFDCLPGGARTGLLLHSVLERADFATLDTTETRELIECQLRAAGFDSSIKADLQRDLQLVASTPLTPDPDSPRLIDLQRHRQLRELEFTLSVDRPSLDDLAKLLARYGAPAAAPGYHHRLAEVSAQRVQQFLRGFIDLVFEWKGRWYVADYKSNTLPTYEPAAVADAVQREHYVLQSQLYTAAVHRYLSGRIKDYNPEKHWGGAMLLFLRGMRGPEQGRSSVFFDRQPADLLRAVDRWLGGAP